jgi:hypothetical protein
VIQRDLEHSDIGACAIAGAYKAAWDYYLHAWRPGKPDEKRWPAAYTGTSNAPDFREAGLGYVQRFMVNRQAVGLRRRALPYSLRPESLRRQAHARRGAGRAHDERHGDQRAHQLPREPGQATRAHESTH